MTSADLDQQIRAILTRYSVYMHYEASSPRGERRYAVWARGQGHVPGTAKQMIEPTTHAEAQAARVGIIASDLVALIQLIKQEELA